MTNSPPFSQLVPSGVSTTRYIGQFPVKSIFTGQQIQIRKIRQIQKTDMVMVIHLIVLIVQIFIRYYYPLYTIQETNNNYLFELLAFRDNEIQFF